MCLFSSPSRHSKHTFTPLPALIIVCFGDSSNGIDLLWSVIRRRREMMEMRRKCRIWWPKQLSLSESSSPSPKSFLFGWFLSSSPISLDVVVAFACSEALFSVFESGLEGILDETNGKLPVSLQEKSIFSVLGHCSTDASSNGQLPRGGIEDDDEIKSSTCGNDNEVYTKDTFKKNCGRRRCGCHTLDGLSEQYRQVSIRNGYWIQLVCDTCQRLGIDAFQIPKLQHVHWNGEIVSQCDVHLIFYESPTYGSHHFSLDVHDSFEQMKAPLKKPKWVDELHQKQPNFDMDTVILAINSATAARIYFARHEVSKRSFFWFLPFICNLFAMSMASFSTLFYILLQLHYRLMGYASNSWIYVTSAKVFNNTKINVQIRCSQILYWPIFLQENGIRSLSCVKYAEEAALHKHSMWSSLVADVLLGNLIGLALLYHAEPVCIWILNFADDITNNLLRSGCVWLMGVPAGFKLNTELAEVLGMISLNAIQIWSTLWIFVGSHLTFFIKGLAILGIIFGVTVPAALTIDLITLATLHVSTIHWLISLLYSTQIQTLASLWRLFRGRKWNPLRQRLDSYDYTVKQHIVGSLLFTPLLLLLPTTSVFYIFFSIVDSMISFICILIEVTISIVHATPYIKILLWLVRPRRFPSGIWFEIMYCQGGTIDSSEDVKPPYQNLQGKDMSSENSSLMFSFLHSNFLSIGQIVLPRYKNVFSGVSGSFIAASAYGVLTGRRMESTVVTGLPPPLPWMFIPYRDYWYLCRDSIVTCFRT
ncbi:uncharacterized protein LOC107431596 isoform X1 [Ziziphus jujuba]|uniref:Uncharacterized protein LOC107431596 isoform X1 n=1 Tax=Ziziphus jujuba TaxID=326968 RepID=A0A6P4ANZ4_ZIZJJ|nr:uncharacterized protein LOC107431596 isoform X1 [Ziziphus jujuba]